MDILRVFACVVVSFWMTQASASTVDALTQVDALGYSCIADEDLEEAWGLGSKSTRLPQTCIPKPCESTLTIEGFSEFLGVKATEEEYATYRERMAQLCGVPNIWAEKGITDGDLMKFLFGGSPLPPEPPVVYAETPPQRFPEPRGWTPPRWTPTPWYPGGCYGYCGSSRPSTVSPVPVPAPGLLLIGALGLLTLKGRKHNG
jgi:hypothetical protein